VRNEEVLLRVTERRKILHEISKRKANFIGYIFRRNCLLRQVIDGKIKGGIEVKGRRGRRLRKLLDDIKERRGYSLLMEEASAFGGRGRRGTRTPKHFVNLTGESKNFKMLEFPLNQLQTYYGFLCYFLIFM
jgi:hypothetical protein